jgi:two-component system chemotaxis sensor kinase CheA
VVEDSTFFRSQITSFLQNNGFAVMEAEDGLAAWELLKSREEEIDLIITDIEMPNMDGLELTKKVKAEEGLSTIPIIALTTLADDQDEEKGKRAGIDDYQIKLDKEQLMNSIKALLQKRGERATP